MMLRNITEHRGEGAGLERPMIWRGDVMRAAGLR
jgi:hypothetical protein